VHRAHWIQVTDALRTTTAGALDAAHSRAVAPAEDVRSGAKLKCSKCPQ
jgi:hypothetical protein